MSESLRPGQHFGAYFIGLVPMAFFSFPLYQVARLFPFVSSLDLREGQVTPLRGVTNFKLIQSAGETPGLDPDHGLVGRGGYWPLSPTGSV